MTSMQNGRLITPQSAPQSLNFTMPNSMINSTKQEVRVQPYGQASYSNSGQTAKFILAQTERAFVNTETMYITGNVEITHSTWAGTTPGTDVFFILGTYYSMFSRWVTTANGKTIDSIDKPSELVNMILNQTLNSAEKRSMANNLGYYNDILTTEMDATFNVCQPINTGPASNILLTGNARSFTFAIPVIGVLNASKQLPMFVSDHQIELTINQLTNWLVPASDAGAGILNTMGFSITNLELVFDQLTLTPESFAAVMAPYPEKLYIKSSTYDFGSLGAIPVTAGAVDIPVGIKRSSLKTAYIYFTQADGVDKTYGGVNPNLADICLITNGQQIPQRPIKCNNPSEVFNQIQKAYGSLYSNNHSGSCGKLEFCRRTTPNSSYYTALLYTTTAGVTSYSNLTTASNKFYMAIDCETLNYNSESLYSGIPMGVNSNWRLNIAETAANKMVIPYYWMHYDAIIEYDIANGIVSVIT